jgi:hypothetical protein
MHDGDTFSNDNIINMMVFCVMSVKIDWIYSDLNQQQDSIFYLKKLA